MWDKVKTDYLLPYFKQDFSNLALVLLSFVELCLFIPVLMTMTYDKVQVKKKVLFSWYVIAGIQLGV